MPMKIHTVLVLASTSIIWLWLCLTTTLPRVGCQPSCRESEKAALVEFSNYSGFDLRGMWGSDIENHTKCVCKWFGVECDQHGFIVKLSLRYDLVEMGGSSVLNTSLATVSWPVPLAKLHFLKELELLGFYHNSPVPQEIGLLSQSLTSLSLPQCKILPPLPLAALTNFSNLAHLDLSSQGVDTEPLPGAGEAKLFLGSPIPQQLCNITTLEYLDLTGNGFVDIPSCIGLLPHLSHLVLFDNNLEGPSILQHIFWVRGSNLSYLDLSSNFLSGHIYPKISSNAVKMRVLKLEGNNLTGNIPESLGELLEMNLLDLGFNHLTGSIPESFGNLKKLGSLDLSNNMLSGEIPHQLGNLTNLGSLDLSNNMLSGEIPHQLGNLANIAIDSPRYFDNIASYMQNSNPLDLSFNQLSGKIPASLGGIGANASMLQVAIDLSHNNLTGDLPWQLLTGSAIDALHLQFNYLTGFAAFEPGAVLAGAVVNKSFLFALDVSYNELAGPVPAWIVSHLSDLFVLDLSHNHLEEATTFLYPSSAFALTELHLGSNNLKGIPTWLSNQSTLDYLDLSFNQLEGTIPAWLWPLKISSIYLSMNKLRGDISLDDVCFCSIFNASQNYFSRLQAPSNNSCSDRNMPGGLLLDLQSNHLSGLLPWHAGLRNSSNSGQIVSWNFLESLNLADNNFFGDLPEFPASSQSGFSENSDSHLLDLSHNKLSGGIPTSIGNWQLTSLRLSSNNFSGEVPISSLCNSTRPGQLAVLKLDGNSLSGSIGDEIGLCSGAVDEYSGHLSGGLSSLVLKDNLLKGFLPPGLANLSGSLQVLDLSHNSFQGGIPPWIQHMQSLRVLVLSHNGFSGHLPPTTWNNTRLQVLDLSSNKLRGAIPSASLSRLSLQGFLYNSVLKSLTTGTLYDESITIQAKDQVLVFTYILSATISLDLSNNALSGPIPLELGLLDGLVFLNLSHNHLSGPIPESLGQLLQLNSLDLSNNELVGDIPMRALCFLTFLGSLDVSRNQLSGPIPQCNQWGTFTRHSFLGNKGLCGRQIEQPCSAAGPAVSQGDRDRTLLLNGEDNRHGFLLAIVVGFCIGFPTLLVLSMQWDPISYHIIRASRWVLS